MDEQQLEQYLRRVLDDTIAEARNGHGEDIGIWDVKTFEEVDAPTTLRGLVVIMRDGSEYHLSIMRGYEE